MISYTSFHLASSGFFWMPFLDLMRVSRSPSMPLDASGGGATLQGTTARVCPNFSSSLANSSKHLPQ